MSNFFTIYLSVMFCVCFMCVFVFLCFQSIVYMCVELKVGWTMEWEGLEDLLKT